MKTTKLNIFFFTLLKYGGHAFAISLFTFSLSNAQMTVKDGDDNILLKVNDYGTTGTVTLPPFGP
ncbi:MAG: hypothetical protein KDC88_17900, partial [Ignavibacteriae bacterium]|nr:hypothetical protein [Ignavibacteriota bacterium]